ncbi:MAG: hypothetical protein ABSG49_09035 [Methanoregula sp.]|uniref:hypothetical protein n=1 Tax=Methanoregula sp. TaxID=2052170 RepID=UPI003C1E48CE
MKNKPPIDPVPPFIVFPVKTISRNFFYLISDMIDAAATPGGKQSKIDIFSTAYGCLRGGSGTNKLFEGSPTAPP